MIRVDVGVANDQGPRSEQQDVGWWARLGRRRTLALVADGMGGETAGGEAAWAAGHAFLQEEGSLHARGHAAAVAVAHLQAQHPTPVGTTFSAVDVVRSPDRREARDTSPAGAHFEWIHVGDSRIYCVRPDTGVSLLTTDHTGAADLLRDGADPADPDVQRARHRLTRFLGGPVRPEGLKWTEGRGDLRPEDALLLCTDGVWAGLPDWVILAAVLGRPAADGADHLLQFARSRTLTDNATVVILRVQETHPPQMNPRVRRAR